MRPRSGGSGAGAGNSGGDGSSPVHDDPDTAALEAEVAALEQQLKRKRKKPKNGRPGSGGRKPKPPSDPTKHLRAAVHVAEAGHDFAALLAEVRKESKDTLQAMDQANKLKGSLEGQVAELSKNLKQVTQAEMSIVDQLDVTAKENAELKASLAKCEEELAVQRALNDEELNMVDELASMEEERDRLRVEAQALRDSQAPLHKQIGNLENDKVELAQLLGKSEKRIELLAERLQGGNELFEKKEKELQAFQAETAEKLRKLDKKIESLSADLSTTKTTLASTAQTLEETQTELADTQETAAREKQQAKDAYEALTAQYNAVKEIVDSTKKEAEEAVKHARDDRTIIVKELRRLQDKEKETRDINALREKETREYRARMEEAQDIAEAAAKSEKTALGQLADAQDAAKREADRSTAMEEEIRRVNEHADSRHAALDDQHAEMNERMDEMEKTMAENLHACRKREEEAASAMSAVDDTLADLRKEIKEKDADIDRLHESIKALESDTAQAWEDLINKHETQLKEERQAAADELASELKKQDEELTTMWTGRLDDEVKLHAETTKTLAETRHVLAETDANLAKQTAEADVLRQERDTNQAGWDNAKQIVHKQETDIAELKGMLHRKTLDLTETRARVAELEAIVEAKNLDIQAREEEKTKLREEVAYMEEKLVSARTDKLDAVADMQVRNVLLEKELVVRNEQAGLNGEAKERLTRDRERQNQRLAEAGRTIDFLRADVRRLDEERIELRETYRKDMQKLTAERGAYMDECDRLTFVLQERNATSEEILSRAKGEGAGLESKLDLARGLFDGIMNKLEHPEDGSESISVTQPLGGIFGAGGGRGPGSVHVSVDVRGDPKVKDEFGYDSEDDEADAAGDTTGFGLTSTSMVSMSSAGGNATAMPKTEELTEGVSTEQWNRRKERRAKQKRELERLRRMLKESEAEKGVLNRALQDLTRNLAQLRFTGEPVDTLEPPKFIMKDGEPVMAGVKTQEGIGGVSAAGSRRTASRMSSVQGGAASKAGSRADSRASLADAAAGASATRAPPPTHFNYGPSLPPPPGAAAEGEGEEGAEGGGGGGMIGSHDAALEKAREPPNLDEIYDYAAYLGLDTALDHELLWIAEEALCCPLPPGWSEHTDSEGNVYFHHAGDDISTYEHPMDPEYKSLAARAKADKSEAAIEQLREEILHLKQTNFVAASGATGNGGGEPQAEPESS